MIPRRVRLPTVFLLPSMFSIEQQKYFNECGRLQSLLLPRISILCLCLGTSLFLSSGSHRPHGPHRAAFLVTVHSPTSAQPLIFLLCSTSRTETEKFTSLALPPSKLINQQNVHCTHNFLSTIMQDQNSSPIINPSSPTNSTSISQSNPFNRPSCNRLS